MAEGIMSWYVHSHSPPKHSHETARTDFKSKKEAESCFGMRNHLCSRNFWKVVVEEIVLV